MGKCGRQEAQGSCKKEADRKSTLLCAIHWVKRSFEYRGKASARKLTVFVAFVLLMVSFIDHLYTSQLIQTELLIIFSTIVLLGLGFLTAENMIELFRLGLNKNILKTNINATNVSNSTGSSAKPATPDDV